MPRTAILLSCLLLSACAAPPRPDPAPRPMAGEVHGTVGVGVSSQRGAIGKADLTLTICNNQSPFSVGVRAADGSNALEARC
ncbi:hypothetical protein SAMN06297129_1745 [Pseudooceanicola antarcticus]|uniref:Lipoprotein n=1 Tax=Pseudooceanicola antarcticus TaxID=1247613 RepID=A0A285IQM2_9RHOB|nr:hypothetical protein [Pseudooceanicola antarcticus]PJE31725.1 hypothetical protein CVM39_01065 [Pseudooceanicola antarcticus]SNY50272.1 hypothetical protein SAMN06297129_1745 [Pseudooceanicola antarcticus]